MSTNSSKHLDLLSLNKDFLVAYQQNDLHALARFNNDLLQLAHEFGQAPSTETFPADRTPLAISLFSHHIHVASSMVTQAQDEIDLICDRFTHQLDLLCPSTSSTTQARSVPVPQDIRPQETNSLPVSNVVLKEWSLTHISNLFPSKEELDELASRTSMPQSQIKLWFRNARTRSGWSKLFAHPKVHKNQARLELILKHFDLLKCHRNPRIAAALISHDEVLQLLDKVLEWFATTKDPKPPKPESVRPWVKDVLNNALAAFKSGTTGAIESSRQLLPSLPLRKRPRTVRSSASPVPVSQSPTPSAGPSRSPSLASDSFRSSITQASAPGSLSSIGFKPSLDSSRCSSSSSNVSANYGSRSPALASAVSSQFRYSMPRSLTSSPGNPNPPLSAVPEMPEVPFPPHRMPTDSSHSQSLACDTLGLPSSLSALPSTLQFLPPIPVNPPPPQMVMPHPYVASATFTLDELAESDAFEDAEED